MNPRIVFGAVLVVLLGGLIGYHYYQKDAEPVVVAPDAAALPSASAEPPPAPATPAAPVIQHPVNDAGSGADLPTLDASDAPLEALLVQLIGKDGFMRWVRPENLVRRIVADVDNLGHPTLSAGQRLIRPLGGDFLVEGSDEAATLRTDNAARYAPLMRLLGAMDLKLLAREYRHYYPLFQQSYRDLGYPDGYFNDRLIAVIDQLLATPEVREPIRLVRPNVMWKFADPQLEALSSGQKLLLRIGPTNAAQVKNRLRELRSLLGTAG